MRQLIVILAGATVLSAASLLSTPAHADAIDGDWCNGSLHLEIKGATILTPGRNTTVGRYNFAYVVPANEPGAGGEITMVFLRPETVHLTRPGQTGGPEVWRRCKPIS